MPGKQSSLLDVFFSNVKNKIDGVKNVPNLCSEHKGVLINLHLNLKHKKPQFITLRCFNNLNFKNIEPLVKNDKDLQSLFQFWDPETVSNMLLRGLNRVMAELAPIKKIQRRKHNLPFWDEELQESYNHVKAQICTANITGNVEDERYAKNLNNK